MLFLAGLIREPPWLIKPRELEVLRGIQDGVVNRDPLYGDLAPWMLGTRQVSWSVTLLIFQWSGATWRLRTWASPNYGERPARARWLH